MAFCGLQLSLLLPTAVMSAGDGQHSKSMIDVALFGPTSSCVVYAGGIGGNSDFGALTHHLFGRWAEPLMVMLQSKGWRTKAARSMRSIAPCPRQMT